MEGAEVEAPVESPVEVPSSPETRSASSSMPPIPPPPADLNSEQDVLAWKREYNIRAREADWKRRQDELLKQKRLAWESERIERENKIALAREARRQAELEAKLRNQHKLVDYGYKERCREAEINRREVEWEQKENVRLLAMHNEAVDKNRLSDEVRISEKAHKCEEMREAARARAEKAKRDLDLNVKREENIKRREALRMARSGLEARKLKTDGVARANAIVVEFTERSLESSADCI